MKKTFFSVGAFIFVFFACASLYDYAHAARVDEIKSNIEARNKELSKIEEEISGYKKEIQKAGTEINTLSGAIKTIDSSRKKIEGDIRVTENKIGTTNLNVERLSLEIGRKEEGITFNLSATGNILRQMYEIESQSLAEIVLSYDNIADFWDSIENLGRLQTSMSASLAELRSLKDGLVENKGDMEQELGSLVTLKGSLSDKKQIAEINKKEKEKLLKQTKNKEAEYKEQLADRLKKKEALEAELREFEAELKTVLDPSLVPGAQEGMLRWPLRDVTITQYFGNTPFATQNPQVYNGKGHNGIDLSAPPGTEAFAAASGMIVDTGDTDVACWGVSYGKWVLIEHPNGLSTLYAHLSLIKASKGQTVSAGETIGYTGNTGYSTGPHLHFTVFASDAVGVAGLSAPAYKSRVCGTELKLPVLTKQNGYLNPLSYLQIVE
ncbi:peptidoglycan DD-metalloendopeptidase family protein [bacterium]|nr:peptidoglycan DD-metalloendopeptidase family protein [bacterium]